MVKIYGVKVFRLLFYERSKKALYQLTFYTNDDHDFRRKKQHCVHNEMESAVHVYAIEKTTTQTSFLSIIGEYGAEH